MSKHSWDSKFGRIAEAQGKRTAPGNGGPLGGDPARPAGKPFPTKAEATPGKRPANAGARAGGLPSQGGGRSAQASPRFIATMGQPLGSNATERAYCRDILYPRAAAFGPRVRPKFESLQFVLIPGIEKNVQPESDKRNLRDAAPTTYLPDFSLPHRVIEIHEVKGPQRWEDSWIKFKMAVAQFPEFVWFWAQRSSKKDGWLWSIWEGGEKVADQENANP